MSLERIIEEFLGKKDADDIAAVSLRMEHQKYKLSKKLPKQFFLSVVNLAIIQQFQVYALTCQLLDAEEDEKTHKEILESFEEEAIGCLKTNIKQMADDIAELKKPKEKDE